MIFVAYYTPDYEVDARIYFEQFIRNIGVEYELVPVKDRGNWSFNTYYTPTVIKQMLDKHPNDTVVKIGADASLRKYPTYLFELEKQKDWDVAINYIPQVDDILYPDCSVVMSPNTQKAREFLTEWENVCNKKLEQGITNVFSDEDALVSIMPDLIKRYKVIKLNTNYGQSWHFDRAVVGEPIIEDFRTSWHHKRNKI